MITLNVWNSLKVASKKDIATACGITFYNFSPVFDLSTPTVHNKEIGIVMSKSTRRGNFITVKNGNVTSRIQVEFEAPEVLKQAKKAYNDKKRAFYNETVLRTCFHDGEYPTTYMVRYHGEWHEFATYSNALAYIKKVGVKKYTEDCDI